MSTAITYPHIDIRSDGLAWIKDTQIKVLEIVQDKLCHGWEPDEIHRNHPHLSLAQIHAAFTFYYDHKDEVDRVIEERQRFAKEMQAKQGESPLQAKLRTKGLIT